MRTRWRGGLSGLVLSGGLVLLVGCGGSTASDQGAWAGTPQTAGIATGTGTTVVGSGVQGRVTDTSGAPVVAATLDRRQVGGGDAPLTALAAVSGPDGRWGWALPPGTWDVTATAPGHRPASGRVVVVEGEQAVLDLVLPPA